MEFKEWMSSMENVLTKYNQGSENSNARPYYPTIFMFNQAQSKENMEDFSHQISKIWSQSIPYMKSYFYDKDDEKYSIYSIEHNQAISEDDFLVCVGSMKSAREYFKSMTQYAFYNIIDTANMKTVEEFENAYRILPYIQEIIPDSIRSMAIVLLDDSSSKRQISMKIREYLSQCKEYMSMVIVANRMRDNSECEMKDLYHIVPDIILATNNDSRMNTDRSYESMIGNLFQHSTYTVAYLSKEKPNALISLQIGYSILNELCSRIESTQPLSFQELVDKLEIKNNSDLSICKDFFKSIHFDPNEKNPSVRGISERFLQYLPMRSNVLKKKLHLENMTYQDLLQYTYKDVLDRLAESISKQIQGNIDIQSYSDDVENFLKKRLSVYQLAKVTEEDIDNLVARLYYGSINETSKLTDYLEDGVREALRREFLYPNFKKKFLTLRQQAIETINKLLAFQNEYRRNIPPYTEREIGTFYSSLVSDFLNRENSQNYVDFMCSPSSSREDIMAQILQCYQHFAEANKEIFSLSFVEEWERRLNMVGDRVYREISEAVKSNGDCQIMLYGNYPLNKNLQVFMLHIDESNGMKTKLYEYLSKCFINNKGSTLYVDTECDDFLSSILFVSCDGNNLIL